MKRAILRHIVLPTVALFVAAVMIVVLVPSTLSGIQAGLIVGMVVLLLMRWGIIFAGWLRCFKYMETVAYLWLNIVLSLGSFALLLATGLALFDHVPDLALLLVLFGLLAGTVWLIASIVTLVIKRKSRTYSGPFWFFLGPPVQLSNLEGALPPTSMDRVDSSERAIATSSLSPKHPVAEPTPESTSSQSRKEQIPFRSIALPSDSRAEPAFKIPDRPISSRPTTNAASNDVGQAQFALHISVSSDSRDFILLAQRYVDRKEEHAVLVPFQEYWPSYRSMSLEQQRWYFYWRNQARQSNFLPTDLSYIFVHVYEIINLIGVVSPKDGFARLDQLWRFYRQAYPKLDNYLIDWIADFIVVHRLADSALDWYAEAQRLGAFGRGNEDLMTEAWLRQGGKFEEISFPLLERLSRYSIQRSKFYQRNCEEIDFLTIYRKSLQAVEDVHWREGKPGLFARYAKRASNAVERPPFQSALHGYGDTPVSIAHAHPWHSYEQLAGELKKLLRGVENMLRAEYKFRSRLQDAQLVPEWEQAIRQALVNANLLPSPAADQSTVAPAKSIAPVIDLDAVERIRDEAEALRRRLQEATEESVEEPGGVGGTVKPKPNDLTPNLTVIPSQDPSPNGQVPLIRPADTPDDLLTDLQPTTLVLGSNHGDGMRLMELLRQRNWRARPEHLTGLFGSGFINVTYDRLNERAYEQLGDAIIFDEDGEWVVAEDYRDEIEFILDHIGSSGNEQEEQEPADVAADEWLQLAQELKSHHWLTLVALHGSVEVMPRLSAIARSVYSTANQLVDEINELALDHMGDNIIDASGNPPAFIEEYHGDLQRLLQWANENSMIEV